MIVRELVTRLGFQFDRTNLDKFERSIIGFKTKFALASAGIVASVKKTLDYFGNVAKQTLDVDELARSTGTATERFIALGRAANQFRIPDFEGAFTNISKILDDARHGAGELFEIFRRSAHQLNLTPFVEKNDIEGAIKAILEYGKTLKDVREQTKLFSDTFGAENAAGFVNVLNQGTEALSRGADAYKEYAQTIVKSKSELSEFEKDLKSFYDDVASVTQSFVSLVLPAVHGFVKGLKGIFSGESFTDEGLKKLHREAEERHPNLSARLESHQQEARNIKDAISSFLGLDTQRANFEAFLNSQKSSSTTQPIAVTNNNKFEFAVSPGTTEQQGIQISDMVRMAIQNTWDEKTREIVSNNPTVE